MIWLPPFNPNPTTLSPDTPHMASSSAHPSFPSRPYASTLGKLPDRTGGVAPFGSSTTQAHRDAQRQERERERAERERIEREGQKQLAELTEEQREEINEAVSRLHQRSPARRSSLVR